MYPSSFSGIGALLTFRELDIRHNAALQVNGIRRHDTTGYPPWPSGGGAKSVSDAALCDNAKAYSFSVSVDSFPSSSHHAITGQ